MCKRATIVKSKPKVVVIEDDIVFANLLELSLRNNGYDAYIIATAKESRPMLISRL